MYISGILSRRQTESNYERRNRGDKNGQMNDRRRGGWKWMGVIEMMQTDNNGKEDRWNMRMMDCEQRCIGRSGAMLTERERWGLDILVGSMKDGLRDVQSFTG